MYIYIYIYTERYILVYRSVLCIVLYQAMLETSVQDEITILDTNYANSGLQAVAIVDIYE